MMYLNAIDYCWAWWEGRNGCWYEGMLYEEDDALSLVPRLLEERREYLVFKKQKTQMTLL